MASGKLGNANLTANTDTVLYTVGASLLATVNVLVVNRATTCVAIRIAVAAANTPTTAEYIEYDFVLNAGGTIERTGLVLTTGERVVVFATNSLCSARVHGFEEAA